MTDVVIVSAGRTAVGSFLGAFANTPAHELGAAVLEGIVARAGIDKSEVSEIILGQVLTAAQGQNPARQAPSTPACRRRAPPGASTSSAARACAPSRSACSRSARRCRDHRRRRPGIDVAGAARRASARRRKMGDHDLVDTMIKDGLWDAFNGYHMGTTAENVARKWQITREQQDEFAVASQNKAEAAQKAGKFKDEIVPVTIKTRKGDVVVDRTSTSATAPRSTPMTKLRPAFAKDGTVTAANASGINDGAAAVVLMTPSRGREARHHAAGPHRLLGDRRRRSGDHGHRPDPGLAQGAGEGRLEGRRPRPGRGQRGLRRAGLRGQQGHGLGSRRSSTSTAAPSPSATRSAPRARASSTRCSTR